MLSYALRRAQTDLSLAELRDDVRGESDQDTRIVTVEVDAARAREAIALANAVAAGLRQYASTNRTPPRPVPCRTLSLGSKSSIPPHRRLASDPSRPAARVRRLRRTARRGCVRPLGGSSYAEDQRRGGSGGGWWPAGTRHTERQPAPGRVLAGTGHPSRTAGPIPAPGRETGAGGRLGFPAKPPRRRRRRGYGSAKVAVDLGLSLASDGHRVTVADFEGGGITRYLQMDGRERGASFFRRSGRSRRRESRSIASRCARRQRCCSSSRGLRCAG